MQHPLAQRAMRDGGSGGARGAHLHELIPDDRVRGLGSHIQKLLEAVPRAVVRAVGTDDVQLLESQVLLDRAHRLHLASDAYTTTGIGVCGRTHRNGLGQWGV